MKKKKTERENKGLAKDIAELQIPILPLIENLEWLYIWGVVRCLLLFVRHRRSVRRSVGPSVGRSVGWGI